MSLPRLTTRRLIFLAVATVLPGLAAAAFEPMFAPWATEWAAVGAATLGGLLALSVLYVLDVLEGRNEVKEPATRIPQGGLRSPVDVASLPQFQGKQFSPRTPAELTESNEGLTTVAAKAASERHLGLLLAVRGTVRDVYENHDNTTTVFVKEKEASVSVFLDFNTKTWGNKLRALNKGDAIFGVGEISALKDHVTLSESMIIDSEP